MKGYAEEGYLRGVRDWEENLKKGIFEEPDNPFEKYGKKRHGWFDGYRESKRKYFNEKYKLPELQGKIRELIESYGLVIKFEDEYNWPYMETPEGFGARLIDSNESDYQ